MSLQLAIIGVGWAGRRQAQAIRELKGAVNLVALVDNDLDHLASTAAELGVAHHTTDFDRVLADPAIDAVSICTPHPLHAPMSLAAIAAGKHVLVEKPMALTVADATLMIEAAAARGVTLFVAENAAYSDRARFLRGMLAEGDLLGELTAVTLVAGFQAEDFGYPGRRAWLTDLAQGGTGTWMLHGIHTVAELRAIFGEVASVYVREHKTDFFKRRDLEGTVSGVLTMQSGLPLSLIQSSETKLPGNLGGYTVYGIKGSLRAGKDGAEYFANDADDPHTPQILAYPKADLSEYAQEIAAFARAVSGDGTGPTDGHNERRSLAVVEAGYASMISGEPVVLAEHFGAL